ncbi:MAG TPA: hypothetical protein ENJ43_04475 [Gammaproteobacteria bacterium]|nr:hypothetical protein [Gammaproteobacteria bacterium]
MSEEKYSPQLLRSILESQGIDASDPSQPSSGAGGESPLERLERMGALKKLSLLLSSQQRAGGRPVSVEGVELTRILEVLAELAEQENVPDAQIEERKRALHVAAAILRRMLHGSGTDHYRALGLDKGATPEQISKHYRLLCKLFWFDDSIDPQQESRQRILDAYTALTAPPAQTSEAGSGEVQRASPWRTALLLLPLLLLFFGVILYRGTGDHDSQPDTASSPDTVAMDVAESPVESDVAQRPGTDASESSVAEPGDDEQALEPEVESESQPAGSEKSHAERNEPAVTETESRRQARLAESRPAKLNQEPVEEVTVIVQPAAQGDWEDEEILSVERAEQPPTLSSVQPAPAAVPEPESKHSLVVVGAPDLAVDTLTREQVRAIFLGEDVHIPATKKPLRAVLKEYGGGNSDFYRKVIGKSPRQYKIHWAKMRFQGKRLPPRKVVGDDAVKNLVARTPGMIGIIDEAAVDGSVKVLLRY